jgi:hypothetical protein
MRLSPKYAVVALVALAACTPALSQPAGGCTGPTEQGDVRSAILANYDLYSPPAPQAGDDKLHIALSAELKMIESVSEPAGSVKMAIEHRMKWVDSRLAFNSSTLNNGCYPHERAVFPPDMLDEIWSPVYSFSNAIGSFGDSSTFLVFKNDGEVTVKVREGIEVSCEFDFRKMPFDEQECYARLEIRAPVEQVDITPPRDGESLFNVPDGGLKGGTVEWDILSTSVVVSETSGSPPAMSYADFTVKLRRKPDYWMSFVLIPSVFLVALSYGTFWIQRGAVPARAAFCFIAYLSTINNTKGALNALPKLSAGDAWILGVLSKSQYFCAYTVVEVVVANYLLHIETRVQAALKEARNKEEISGQQISDMQAFVRARAGKFGSALIRKDGTMAFSDQNVDVLSRWLFPAAYVVAFGTVTAMAGVVGA